MTTNDTPQGNAPLDEEGDPTTLNYARPGTERPSMSLVTIATFGHSWEAHLAAGKLEAAGIPAVLVDENINAVGGGIYTSMVGGIKLQVPQIDVDRALGALPQRVRINHVKCPKCGSTDTRQVDFSAGLKIFFLLLLGIPYLFVHKPWICLSCSNVWRATPEQRKQEDNEDDDDEEESDDDDKDEEGDEDDASAPSDPK
jgi:hypothetical protein